MRGKIKSKYTLKGKIKSIPALNGTTANLKGKVTRKV